jgi:hypothetical protein
VWGALVAECLALLVWAWSKQLRNLTLRPWERWVTAAHPLLLVGVLVLAMAMDDWGPRRSLPLGDFLSVDESFGRLHKAGWSLGLPGGRVVESGHSPIQVTLEDFEAANWIVVLKEAEHQPLLLTFGRCFRS